MPTTNIVVKQLARSIGAEISGVNLAEPMDDATFAAVHAALMDHSVIFFRDQKITDDQQVELAKRFGTPLPSKKLKTYGDKYDCLSLLENDGSKIAIGSVWHTDNTDYEEPPMGSLLYCEIAPEVGGDTMWASMYAAYEALAPATQAYLEQLSAMHDNSNVARRYAGHGGVKMDGLASSAIHPLVHRHPVTGRKALFFNNNYGRSIVGLSDIESKHLMAMLGEHVQRPEFQVRFHWLPGSLAIWDNRCTQHHALDDYNTLRRMRRVQLAGHRPSL
jgi:taurine dioxygenase